MADARSDSANHNANKNADESVSSTDESRSAELSAEVVGQALRETLEGSGGVTAVSAEELAALQAIATRFGPVPLTLDPIALELVETLLRSRLANVLKTPELSRWVAQQVASAFMEDPVACSRLTSLWEQLHPRRSV